MRYRNQRVRLIPRRMSHSVPSMFEVNKLNRRYLPSVTGLLAFESAARHGSITAAASELNLTQSAVSRQIRQLEDSLDVGLFERIHQRVQLTNTGRAYLADVARILNDLSSATHRTVTGAGASCNLNLAVLPTFATRWLIPRLPLFLDTHPGVMLSLCERNSPFEFSADSADAAIHYGSPTWPAGVPHFLMGELLVAVCSPALRDGHNLKAPQDFSRVVLLHEASRMWAWPDWFRKQGVDKVHASRGPCFEQSLMLAQAAISGLGIALLPRFVIEDELSNGTLVQPVEHDLLTDRAYYLVVPESKSASPVVESFRIWLTDQAQSFRSVKTKVAGDVRADASARRPTRSRQEKPRDASEIPAVVRPWEYGSPRLPIARMRDR
jgi:LysR family transcriptional regulator, glycine cleavage system transcriptional activator